jgi:ATP-dependent Clp protease ATP-binding subunit ClpA
MKPRLVVQIFTLSALLLASPVAHANSRRGLIEGLFERFLGLDDASQRARKVEAPNSTPSPQQAARAPSQPQSYEQAVRNGEIWPRLIDEAADPFAKVGKGGLFYSLRTRDLVKTQGQAEALEKTHKLLYTQGRVGAAIIGEKGAGKTQIVESIEYAFRMAAKNDPGAKESFVIRINTSNINFRSAESFASEVQALRASPEFQKAGKVVFYFDNLSPFQKSEGLFDAYLDILNRAKAQGQDVRFILESDPLTYREISKGSNFAQRINSVFVRETPELEELVQATKLRHMIDKQAPQNLKYDAAVSDQSIASLVRWLKRYAPGDGIAQKALDAIDEARAAQEAFMRTDFIHLTDEVTDSLKTDLQYLQERLAKVQKMPNGANARRLKEELPETIATTRTRIEEAEKEYRELIKLRKRRDEILALQNQATGNEAAALKKELKTVEAQLMRVSDRRLAIEVSRITGAPLSQILEFTGRMSLKQFRRLLDKEIIGQSEYKEALMECADRIINVMSGGRPPHKNRSLCNILAYGPPGTGKTHGAALLQELADGFMLIPGAEYSEAHNVGLLLGATPGYVGSETGGQLINHILQRPRSVIVIDEINNADARLVNYVSGAMDPGIGSDTLSRVKQVEFYDTTFIVTTNAGQHIIDASKFSDDEIKKLLQNDSPYFTDAFLSRFDRIVQVPKTSGDENIGILEKFLRILNGKPEFMDLEISVDLTEAAKRAIVDHVEKETSGTGRDVRNQVDRQVKDRAKPLLAEAKNLISDPAKEALDQGQYIDDATGNVVKLRVRPGDALELDVDEAGNFVFRVLE